MAESDGQSGVEGSQPRARDQFKDTFVSLAKSPHAALEIALVIILVLSFLAIAFTWLDRRLFNGPGSTTADSFVEALTSTQLKVPLTLFGASIMALLVLTTTRGVAVLIAVLIIGTIVAQERFLMALAHMFSGSKAPYVDYYSTPLPANDGQSRQIYDADLELTRISEYPIRTLEPKVSNMLHSVLRQAIIEVVGASAEKTNLADQLAKRAALLLDEEINKFEFKDLADNLSNPDVASRHTTLAAVVDGYTDFRSVSEKVSMNPPFEEQMRKLKSEGYISCEEGDWTRCVPTDAGRDFVNQLR